MTSLGTIVKNWREGEGLKVADLAKELRTSRQNLENLEADAVKQPRYLAALAKRMGYDTVEQLQACQLPPGKARKAGGISVVIDTRTMLDLSSAVDFIAQLVEQHDDSTRDAAAAAFAGLVKDPKNERLKRALLTLLVDQVAAPIAVAGGTRSAPRSSGKRPRGAQR